MKWYFIYHCRDYRGFLCYFEEHCDLISLSRGYHGKVDDRVPFALQHPKVQEALLQIRNNFLEHGACSLQLLKYDKAKLDTLQLFDALLDQTIEALNANSARHLFGVHAPETQIVRDQPFFSTFPEYLGKWYTWHTGVTTGTIHEMSFFKPSDAIKAMIESMQSLFDVNCRIDGFAFEDPVFYQEGKPLLSICSHEDCAVLSADGDMPEELQKFGLAYDVG